MLSRSVSLCLLSSRLLAAPETRAILRGTYAGPPSAHACIRRATRKRLLDTDPVCERAHEGRRYCFAILQEIYMRRLQLIIKKTTNFYTTIIIYSGGQEVSKMIRICTPCDGTQCMQCAHINFVYVPVPFLYLFPPIAHIRALFECLWMSNYLPDNIFRDVPKAVLFFCSGSTRCGAGAAPVRRRCYASETWAANASASVTLKASVRSLDVSYCAARSRIAPFQPSLAQLIRSTIEQVQAHPARTERALQISFPSASVRIAVASQTMFF
eukprot:IDg23955t1